MSWKKQKKKKTDPLVDLLVDGGLPAGGSRNFEPFDERLDGETLTRETHLITRFWVISSADA